MSQSNTAFLVLVFVILMANGQSALSETSSNVAYLQWRLGSEIGYVDIQAQCHIYPPGMSVFRADDSWDRYAHYLAQQIRVYAENPVGVLFSDLTVPISRLADIELVARFDIGGVCLITSRYHYRDDPEPQPGWIFCVRSRDESLELCAYEFDNPAHRLVGILANGQEHNHTPAAHPMSEPSGKETYDIVMALEGASESKDHPVYLGLKGEVVREHEPALPSAYRPLLDEFSRMVSLIRAGDVEAWRALWVEEERDWFMEDISIDELANWISAQYGVKDGWVIYAVPYGPDSVLMYVFDGDKSVKNVLKWWRVSEGRWRMTEGTTLANGVNTYDGHLAYIMESDEMRRRVSEYVEKVDLPP